MFVLLLRESHFCLPAGGCCHGGWWKGWKPLFCKKSPQILQIVKLEKIPRLFTRELPLICLNKWIYFAFNGENVKTTVC